MKFIPILFSTPMVQAILNGSKTQTRRTKGLELINDKPNEFIWLDEYHQDDIPRPARKYDDRFYYAFTGKHSNMVTTVTYCPYGKRGDILWVRETFFGYSEEDENKYVYFADTRDARPFGLSDDYCINEWGGMNKDMWPRWKPNIHMPKSACRIFLKITNVRVERLQDISEEDAVAEGIEPSYTVNRNAGLQYKNYFPENKGGPSFVNPIWSFESLWQYINGEQSWKSNPWVWVIEFERIEKPENFI